VPELVIDVMTSEKSKVVISTSGGEGSQVPLSQVLLEIVQVPLEIVGALAPAQSESTYPKTWLGGSA
jgi:hypothetical protein